MSQTKAQLLDPVDLTIVTDDIANGAINNAKVNASAAIDVSKLSGVMPLAGGIFTGDVTFDGATAGRDIVFDMSDNALEFADNAKSIFGTGSDLQIYHNGSHSYIQDAGTGNLYVYSNYFIVSNAAGNEDIIKGAENGAVELYYDASKKFETSSAGVAVSGDIYLSGELNLTNGSDTQRFIDAAVGTSALTLRGTTSNDANHQIMARFFRGGACELNHNGNKKLETTSGGALVTGNFYLNDNGELTLGTGGDLKIYHNGSNSYIDDSGTGSLIARTNQFLARNISNDENMIVATANGSVDLYYDNSKKFETWTSGARLPSDNNVLAIGAGDDLRFWHNATNSIIRNLTGQLQIQSNDLRLGTYNFTETYLKALENGAVELYHDNSKKFETTSTGAKISSSAATLRLVSTTNQQSASLELTSSSSESQIGKIAYNHANSGIVSGYLEAFLIDGTETNLAVRVDGAIKIPDSGTKDAKLLIGTGDDLQIYHDGSNSRIVDVGTGNLIIQSNEINLKNAGSSEALINATHNGSVELYFDNSKKLETTSSGVQAARYAFDSDNYITCNTTANTMEFVTNSTDIGEFSPSGLMLRDNMQLRLGTGNDLRLYHDGTNSYIKNNTNSLFINSLAHTYIANNDNSEYRAKFHNDSSVELYFDNSKKFQTNSGGADVTGDFGLSGEFNMTAGGNKNRFIDCSLDDGEALFIRSTQGGDANHEAMALFLRNQQVELYYDNVKKLNTSSGGIEIAGTVYFGQGHAVNVMNRESDGTLLEFKTTGTARGSISVSGNTVSYNGGHLSRWSQIKGLSTTDKSARPTLYKGTVLSNLDDLCVWTNKEPEQLNMTKVSDTVGDKDVAGVFLGWDENNSVEVNDLYISMTGDMVIRVAGSTTVARGDLLISAGDGTAKPQADDIVRSSTIAKITSTIPTTTYADGSKAYPCVLMAC